MMLLFFRFCLLLFSLTGYLLFLTQKYRIRIEFVPALFCAWCSNLLLIGGLLNCLPVTVFLLFAGGFVLLALSVHHKYFLTKQDRFKYAGFLTVIIYFYILMQGSHFISYDNFSHWATVIKDMLAVNRMPNFEDFIIRFQSYPLGSSLFIFYICKIIGTSDACLLFGQLLMLISFLFCIVAFVKKENIYSMLIFLLYSIWALTSNIHIYELRVDTLLPLAGVAAFAWIYYYKSEPQKAVFGSTGIFILLIQIKNSGIFFYAVCAICLTIFAWDYCKKNSVHFLTASLFVPLASLYLWKRHVAFAFSAGMKAKHSMNLAHFKQEVAKKSTDDMLAIGKNILKQFTSLKKQGTTPGAGIVRNQGLILLVLLAMFLLAMCVICLMFLRSRQAFHAIVRIIVLDVSCLVLYTLSVYAMYLFSMPPSEASRLASFDRYMFSIYIFIYGITIIFILSGISVLHHGNTQAAYLIGIVTSLLFVLPVNFCNQLPTLIQKPEFASSKRNQLQQLLKQEKIQNGDSCFIYSNTSDTNARYLFYLTRYELWSPKVLSVNSADFGQKKKKIKKYDYFIIWDCDAQTDQYLIEHQLTQYVGKSKICIPTSITSYTK